MIWAEAKAKFSEVLDKAETSGSQIVARRKREFVVLTREEHEKRSVANAAESPKPFVSAWDALVVQRRQNLTSRFRAVSRRRAG